MREYVRMILLVAALTAWIAPLGPAARAESDEPKKQQPPVAIADLPVGQGHGWIAMRDEQDMFTRILHLPPRDGSASSLGAVGFAPGTSGAVEKAAWWRDKLYLALAPRRFMNSETGTVSHFRAVEELTVTLSAIGTWVCPADRPLAVSQLPGDPELIAISAGQAGLFALSRPARRGAEAVPDSGDKDTWLEQREAQALELRLLSGGRWERLALPWQSGGLDGDGFDAARVVLEGRVRPQVRMWADRDGVGMLVYDTGGAEADLWTGRRGMLREGEVGPPRPLVWSHRPYPLVPAFAPDASALPRPSRLDQVMFIAGPTRAEDQVIALCWRAGQDAGAIKALRPSGPVVLARFEAVPRDAWVVPMNGSFDAATGTSTSGRVTLVWHEDQKQTSGSPGTATGSRSGTESTSRALHVQELSVQTGGILYDGPAKSNGWISRQRYQTLAIVLVLMTACVLAFVLRGGSGGVLDSSPATARLPKGVVPADPARRLFAAALDYTFAAVAASVVMQVPVANAFNPGLFVIADADLTPMLAAFGLAIVHCSLGEWLVGRSLGKALTGCLVVSVQTETMDTQIGLGRLMLWQALARNVVRWLLPLLALFVLMDPVGRHPGDLAARTMVVMRGPDEEQEA